MKKAFLLFTTIFVATTTLSSCDSIAKSLSDPKMDTVEATEIVAEAVKKNIDLNDWKIYDIAWREEDKCNNDLESVSVSMIDKSNNAIHQSFTVAGKNKGFVTSPSPAIGYDAKSYTFDATKGIDPAVINPEAIQKQIEAAKALLPEGYTFKSLAQYQFREKMPQSIGSNNGVGNIAASFKMTITEDGNESVTSAGQTTYQYYEVWFHVQPDGSVKMDEDW